MTETRLHYLEHTGLLPMHGIDHYLRPDLSNITVCGRYDVNRLPDERLTQPITETSGRRLCLVCQLSAAGTWGAATAGTRR